MDLVQRWHNFFHASEGNPEGQSGQAASVYSQPASAGVISSQPVYQTQTVAPIVNQTIVNQPIAQPTYSQPIQGSYYGGEIIQSGQYFYP